MFGQPRLTAFFAGLVEPLCAIAQTAEPVVSLVANVASYSAWPVAPGEMGIGFGTGLGPSPSANLQLVAQGRVANTLSLRHTPSHRRVLACLSCPLGGGGQPPGLGRCYHLRGYASSLNVLGASLQTIASTTLTAGRSPAVGELS
jgi:hypothetical protein